VRPEAARPADILQSRAFLLLAASDEAAGTIQQQIILAA
jgi:hypothetical protein